jgi:hypothetical protein
MNLRHALATAAVGGLIAGLAGCDKPAEPASGDASATPSSDPNCCVGKNDCKGKGGCGSKEHGHSCAGKNDCKGQGGCKHRDCG